MAPKTMLLPGAVEKISFAVARVSQRRERSKPLSPTKDNCESTTSPPTCKHHRHSTRPVRIAAVWVKPYLRWKSDAVLEERRREQDSYFLLLPGDLLVSPVHPLQ